MPVIKEWINWRTILTSIVSLIVIGLGTASFNKVRAAWIEYREIVTSVRTHTSPEEQVKAAQNAQVLEQIAKDIKQIKVTGMTVTGFARIQNVETAEVFMQINTMGRAEIYVKAKKARVTNLSSEDSPSIVVLVNGVFRNNDENYLILLSKRAADLLGISAGQMVKVRIEPIQDDL